MRLASSTVTSRGPLATVSVTVLPLATVVWGGTDCRTTVDGTAVDVEPGPTEGGSGGAVAASDDVRHADFRLRAARAQQ
jgi:hypothetical protein